MQYLSLLAIAGAAAAQSVSKGFNYGNVFTDGRPKEQSDFEAEFNRAQTLPNTSGFTSARLYTMIQGGTTNTPISAIQAAIDTQTTLLLGLWASASPEVFQNELDALSSAIQQYGSDLTDLIVGISVGSEDLYRVSVQGIENDSGLGEGPDVLVDYIQRTRSVIEGTAASEASIGHVDTWNDWVNGSNSAVIEAVDWIGFNAFPFWEASLDNDVANGNSLFFAALNSVEEVAQDKPVWITESGWPVSGPTQNQAVASTENSKTFWDEVGCDLFNDYNVWWYILRDNNAQPAPEPSFGIVGIDLEDPLFDLTCPSGSSGAGNSARDTTASDVVSDNVASPENVNVTGLAEGAAAQGVNVTGLVNDTASAESVNATNLVDQATSGRVNLTEAVDSQDTPHSVASTFSKDMPAIMESLPAICAANPSTIKKLPDLIAANPALVKKVDDLDLKEMASKYNVAPIYVDMLKDAIEKVKKGETDEVVGHAKNIAQLLRSGGE